MNISFEKRPSNIIRVLIRLDGFERIRKSLPAKFRASPHHKWIDQRVSGKNSIVINQEMDRIETELNTMIQSTQFSSQAQLEKYVNRLIDNINVKVNAKTIEQHFERFLLIKSTEINPLTKERLSKVTIRDYRTAFEFIKDYELEDFTKANYHVFSGQMLSQYSANYTGKVIRKMVTFFRWCDSEGLPISKEFKSWKPYNEESSQDERALNSEQLSRIYHIEIDPVNVYQIAQKTHKKKLDVKHVQDLCLSIQEAAHQAVAIASIGAHKEDFWKLSHKNIQGNKIVYHRGKNKIKCIAPFRDNHIFHAQEFANLNGGPLFKRLVGINYYLTYVKELCEIPFHITASNFRKTFASIMYFELQCNLSRLMMALGHKKESTTRIYLGIQMSDVEEYDEELFRKN
jgi:hypothetical protein